MVLASLCLVSTKSVLVEANEIVLAFGWRRGIPRARATSWRRFVGASNLALACVSRLNREVARAVVTGSPRHRPPP